MWITLTEFTDGIAVCEQQATSGLQATLGEMYSLGTMYRFIDQISWLNCLVLQLHIRWKFSGEERSGYLDTFAMYKVIRRIITNPPQGSGVEEMD